MSVETTVTRSRIERIDPSGGVRKQHSEEISVTSSGMRVADVLAFATALAVLRVGKDAIVTPEGSGTDRRLSVQWRETISDNK